MKKNSLDLEKDELKKVQAQIEYKKTELHNLDIEVQAALRSQSQIKADINKETTRLLTVRAKQLAEVENRSSNAMLPLEKSHQDLTESVTALEGEVKSLQDYLTTQRDASAVIESTFSSIQDETKSTNESLIVLKAQHQAEQEALKTAQEQRARAEDETSALQDTIQKLKEHKYSLQTEIDATKSKYEVEIGRYEKRIADLTSKKLALSSNLRDEETKWDQIRNDLADRKLMLDEREAVLSRREYKVNQNEHKIELNAGLLDL